MRFFEQQTVAKKNSFYLILLFTIAVTGVALITATAVSFIWHFMVLKDDLSVLGPFLNTFKILFFLTAGLISSVSFIRLLFPASGHSIAQSLGDQLLSKDSKYPDERKLLNVVEEMSIASGVPVTPVYVLIHDNTINAFAAGSDPFHSIIAVTKGAMTALTREELQGVVGHEFSHICHDLRLNLRINATISGLMAIASLGRFLIRASSNSRRGPFKTRSNEKQNGALVLAGMVLFVVGYLDVFFARMIQSAISRQREHLADASATQFTRNPLGLASALAKILYLSGSSIGSARNYEMDHYFFARCFARDVYVFISDSSANKRKNKRNLSTV